MKGIPPRFIPTGEQQRYNLETLSPQLLDLESLSTAPAGALFTCFSNGNNGKAGIGLAGDVNGYSFQLNVNESLLIENFGCLNDLYLICIGGGAATADVQVIFLTQL